MMRVLFLILIPLACLLGCSDGDAPSEQSGSTRIVVLSPAAADILVDLDRDRLIVGRHNFDTQLDSSIPAVGDQSTIDYEMLLSLDPSHVIVQTESQPIPARLEELAESADFQIINISTLSLDDVLATTRVLERQFAPDADLAKRFQNSIRQRTGVTTIEGGVLVAMYCSPTVDVLGPGSAHQEIIERLGYAPAITDGKPYMPLDAEDVLAINPGVIVLVQPRDEKVGPSSALPNSDQLGILSGLEMDAVTEGRVILIEDSQALTSGTSLIGVIEKLERQLEALSPLGSQHDDDQDRDNTEARPG
ncbi:MAG: ABC transporter substrate-binding protein [Phycisphaera sp.]|nr:MAG: ABC transporter substrate-binding protein [Phycisphaera sp.]